MGALARVAALLAGAAAGLLGSFVHAYTAYGVGVGLVVALGLSLSVLVTLGLATGGRRACVLAAVGWLAVVLVLSSRRPEGDLVVAGDGLGYGWLFGGTLVVVLAAAFPYGRLTRLPPAG